MRAAEVSRRRRKRQRPEEGDEDESTDEGDEFYDRTKRTKTIKEKQKAAVIVHDAASILGRKVQLHIGWLVVTSYRHICIVLDDLLSGLQAYPTDCKSQGGAILTFCREDLPRPQAGLLGEVDKLSETLHLEEQKMAKEQGLEPGKAGEQRETSSAAEPITAEDPLDAFMSDVKDQLEQSKARYLPLANSLCLMF